MNSETSPLEIFAEILHRHGVEFIVIGGQAATLHGSPLVTYDTDICYQRTSENLQKLAAALQEIQPTLRGAPADLPFTLDARSLALGSNFTFETKHGPFDMLGWVEPIGQFEELVGNAEHYELGGEATAIISLDDLIRIKEHIGRSKDQAALVELRAIRDERERGS